MRSFFPGLFFLLAIAFTSCSKEDENQYIAPAVIALKTSIPLGAPGAATLSFDEVVSDSRCPANALCTWAGIAIAKFTFTEGKESYPFMLSVMPGFPKQDTLIRGYHIEFSDLRPYPGLATEKTTIQAEVRVTKL